MSSGHLIGAGRSPTIWPSLGRNVLTLEMGAGRKSIRKPGFIDSVLHLIGAFYGTVVQTITPWTPKAPKITAPPTTAASVDDDDDTNQETDESPEPPPPAPIPLGPAPAAYVPTYDPLGAHRHWPDSGLGGQATRCAAVPNRRHHHDWSEVANDVTPMRERCRHDITDRARSPT